MKLYELTNEMERIADNLEAVYSWEPDTDADGRPIDDDGNIIESVEKYRSELLAAWRDTLEAVSGEFDEKAGNIAAYIKSLKAQAEELHKEERALQMRRKVKENALARMTEYLLSEMECAGRRKIDTPRAAISLRNNPESAQIPDEKGFICWAQESGRDDLLTYRPPEISKTAVKRALQSGEELPGASLGRTMSVVIK